MLRPPLPQAGGQSAPLSQSPGLDPVLTPPGSPLLRVSQLSRRGMMGTLRAMPNLQVYHRDNPLPAPPGAGKVWGAQAALLDRARGLDLAAVARRALAADTPLSRSALAPLEPGPPPGSASASVSPVTQCHPDRRTSTRRSHAAIRGTQRQECRLCGSPAAAPHRDYPAGPGTTFSRENAILSSFLPPTKAELSAPEGQRGLPSFGVPSQPLRSCAPSRM